MTDDEGAAGTAASSVGVAGPADSIRWLIEKVEGLIGDGTLRRGQGYSLLAKLRLALWFLQFRNGQAVAVIMLQLRAP